MRDEKLCPEKFLHRFNTIPSDPFKLIAEDYYYTFDNKKSFDIDYIVIDNNKYSKAYITFNRETNHLKGPDNNQIRKLNIYYTNNRLHSGHFQPKHLLRDDNKSIVLYAEDHLGFRLILERVDSSTPGKIANVKRNHNMTYTPPTTPPPTPAPSPIPKILSKYNTKSKTFKKTNSYDPNLVGEYTNTIYGDIILDTDHKLKSVITDYKTKCEKQSQHDYILPDNIKNDDKMSDVINKLLTSKPDIINNLIKTDPDFTCCDNVDMGELVLKTSIVPCSNLIPDKYKKYGEKYDPNVDKKSHEIKPPELHKHRVHDKFSILIIVLICLLIFIIILNII